MTGPEYQRLRAKLGLSIRALAEQLQVDKSTVTRREQGEHPITREAEYAIRYLLTTRRGATPDR